MLYEEREIWERLWGMAWRAAHGSGEAEDMLEEAIVQLWLIETKRPGQSVSWYFERCHRYLQDFRRRGRSVDSAKRASGLVRGLAEPEEPDESAGAEKPLVAKEDTFAEVSARDLERRLEAELDGCSRAILRLLAEGRGVRETATALGMSVSVTHSRVCNIRRAAKRLGI